MYIVELFLKLKQDYKLKQGIFSRFKKPLEPVEEVEKCNHIFVPIDSTGRVLACKNCGVVYKLKKNENNPFK